MTISELGAFIDAKLAEYEGNKQDNDFRSLVFAIGKLCNKISGLEDSMNYFRESKNSLIVWSLGEGETMDLVGAIVEQGDEKIKVVKELLENNSLDELNDLVSNRESIKGLRSRNKELEDENAHLKQIIQNLTSGEIAEIDSEESELSKKKMYEAQLEAQRKLIESRPDWQFPKHYGECDDEGKPYCFSTINVTDENGEDLPIVLKSYKSHQAKFKINPEEWDWVVQNDAKLLVYTTVNGELDIVEVPQSDLVMNQSNISITFCSENLDKEQFSDRVSDFADTLHYFTGLHFNFDRFHIAPNATRVRNIHNKRQGKQDQTTEDDI